MTSSKTKPFSFSPFASPACFATIMRKSGQAFYEKVFLTVLPAFDRMLENCKENPL